MATSGTYTFNPSVGDVVLSAYARCGIRRTELLAEHMVDARSELNYLLSEWSNRQVNLWTVDLVTLALTSGVATYNVLASTVMILDAYISTSSSADQIISPVSRSEYASFPDKTTTGTPSVFWFDRLIAPTITLWQTPDSTQTYTLKYYRCRQVQDANIANGETTEVPYRWIDALVSGLSARLALIYKPEIAAALDTKAERSWQIAATQDIENRPLVIMPAIGRYFR